MKKLLSYILTIVFVGLLQAQDYTLAPNSYIFTGQDDVGSDVDGLYIPVKKAYDMWSGGLYMNDYNTGYTPISGTVSVSVLWEDTYGLIKNVQLDSSCTSCGTGQDAKIKVWIDKSKGYGNAVIALHEGNTPDGTNVLWSWHVWVTDDPTSGVKFAHAPFRNIDTNSVANPIEKDINKDQFLKDDFQFMDRNLGATSSNITGKDWNKSGGLMYQWGRKDPFPPMTYKDLTTYPVNSIIGDLVAESFANNIPAGFSTIPKINRPNPKVRANVQFSVKNPLTYIESHTTQHNWYAVESKDEDRAYAARLKLYSLLSDFSIGDVGGGGPVSFVNQHFKYNKKSPFDPCPDGWVVPSDLHSSGWQDFNFYHPFGPHTGLGGDINPINAGEKHDFVNGVKVYPALGLDFTNASYKDNSSIKMNIGQFPLTGRFYDYGNGYIFTDVHANANIWNATPTTSVGSGWNFSLIADAERYGVVNNGISGQYLYKPGGTGNADSAAAIRCMKDPNHGITISSTEVTLPTFPTEYFVDNTYTDFKDGINNPNSYLVVNENTIGNVGWKLTIPINKAFSMYNQYLTDHGDLSTVLNNPTASVLWTDDTNLIHDVVLNNGTSPNGTIEVIIKGNTYGNAIIALHKNSVATDDNVAWSWHIWAVENSPGEFSYTTEDAITPTNIGATNFDDNIVNPTSSGFPPITTTYMDRNLGAIEVFDNHTTSATLDKTKGLYYQWGRKDPLTLNATSKSVTFSTSDLDEKEKEAFNFSASNPTAFIDNGSSMDWITDDVHNFGVDRWGHTDGKSPFDPCPNGWRVPDVTFVHNSKTTVIINGVQVSRGKGTSPWYLSKGQSYSRPGLHQALFYDIDNQNVSNATSFYPGETIVDAGNTLGWVFENPDYNIGNFPNTGRIESNSTINNNLSGVWTAAISEYYTGSPLALVFNKTNNKLATGYGFDSNVQPKMAMNVRCSKHIDEIPNLGQFGNNNNITPVEYRVNTMPINDNSTLNEISILGVSENEVEKKINVYPNPTQNNVYVKSDININSWKLSDVSGKIVKQNNNVFENQIEIDLSNLTTGVYIFQSTLETGKVYSTKIIKK